MEYDKTVWLYDTNPNNRARYTLGTRGQNPLVCFGLNPSRDHPGEINGTVNCVRRRAQRHGFDSWIMLNLYPQRALHPDGLHKRINLDYHRQNLQHIEAVLAQGHQTLWAAWGTIIEKRSYLHRCLHDIYQLTQRYEAHWVTIGQRSKQGHPHHPLYLPNSATLDPFPMDEYLVR